MAKKLIPSVCPYCAVGCGLFLEVERDKAMGIDYMKDHPASEGALCTKGNAVLEFLNPHSALLVHPVIIFAFWT